MMNLKIMGQAHNKIKEYLVEEYQLQTMDITWSCYDKLDSIAPIVMSNMKPPRFNNKKRP